MPSKIIFAIALILALALPAAATAAPEYEPNDGIHQAFGPLEANKDYDAVISSTSDVDWYIVYVSGPGVLDMTLTTFTDYCCGGTNLHLRDQDGTTLNSTAIWNSERSSTNLKYTVPGAGHYYISISVWNNAPQEYRLNLTGPVTSGPRPGPSEVTPNNNPNLLNAFGPLHGGKLYGGSIDARGEEDWFVFYTARAGRFEVSFTNINDADCCGSPTVRLLDDAGETLNSASPSQDRIARLPYSAPRAAKFYLQVSGGNPVDSYQFRIDPASLITRTSPPKASPPGTSPPASSQRSEACTRALTVRQRIARSVRAIQGRIATIRMRYRSARRAGARRKILIAHKRNMVAFKKRRAGLQRANQNARQACSTA